MIVDTTGKAQAKTLKGAQAAVAKAMSSGEHDARKIFGAMAEVESTKRKTALEQAEKLNGDQRQAYLDGLEKGIVGVGMTEGYARRVKYEFAAIFAACDLSVTVPVKSKDADGNNIEVMVDTDKNALAEIQSYKDLVERARLVRKVAGIATETETGEKPSSRGNTQVRAMKDDKFNDVREELMTRTTAEQSLGLLDAGITRVAFYYSEAYVGKERVKLCAEELAQMREIEGKIHAKIKAHQAETEKAAKATKAVQQAPAQDAAEAGRQALSKPTPAKAA